MPVGSRIFAPSPVFTFWQAEGGTTGAKFAVRLTALLGIENEHGLADAPPLHDAPDIDQLEKVYPIPDAVAVTEIAVPAA